MWSGFLGLTLSGQPVCSRPEGARTPVHLGGNPRAEHGGARGQRGARLQVSHKAAGVR